MLPLLSVFFSEYTETDERPHSESYIIYSMSCYDGRVTYSSNSNRKKDTSSINVSLIFLSARCNGTEILYRLLVSQSDSKLAARSL